MNILLLILITTSPALLFATLAMLVKNKSFWIIISAHVIVFLTYIVLIIEYSEKLLGYFPDNSEHFMLVYKFVLGHLVLGFIHALQITYFPFHKSKENHHIVN